MTESFNNRFVKALIIAVIIVFAVLRFLNLEADVPAGITWSSEIYGDEGLYVRNAVARIITGKWLLPMESNPIVVMPVFQIIEYVFFTIMGVNLISSRIAGVFLFILTIIFLYLIYRRSANSMVSFFVLALVVCNHLFFVYSRLALNENLMLLFAVIAFYLGLIYHKRSIFIFILPCIIFLAILAKISALSIWIPVSFVILYTDNGFKITLNKLKRMGASILIFVVLCILYFVFVLRPYNDYGGYYLAIVPIFPDSMHGISSVIYAVYKILRNGYLVMHGIYCIGYITGVIGMISVFFLKKIPYRRLQMAFSLWVITYAIAGAIGGGYNPPRYYIFTIIPLISIMGLLVVGLRNYVLKYTKAFKIITIVILSGYIASNMSRTIIYMLHPEWSFSNMSNSIKQTILKSQRDPVIITDIIDTYALASGMLVLNIETGPSDKSIKFSHYKPSFLITLGPITDNEVNYQYVKDFASIELQKTFDVFHNHHNGKPVYFYRLN